MNPDEILDYVLRFIYEPIEIMKLEQRLDSFTIEQLYTKLKTTSLDDFLNDKDSFLLSYTEFNEVLEKLHKDGYISQHIFQGNLPEYDTTFEGRWFIYQGGYVAKSAALDEEKQKNDFDTLQSLRNGQRLNWLTFVLCICTGGLIFYQIWHDTNPVWSISLWAAFFLFGSGLLAGLCIWLLLQEALNRKHNK